MDLNDLLQGKGIDPQKVLVLRRRPWEVKLNKVIPWIAAERPDLFNAYQQSQKQPLEEALQRLAGSGYVASFIGHEPAKALFVGLYSIKGSKPLTYEQFWAVPENLELKALGMSGFANDPKRPRILWFQFQPADFYASWKGKLVVVWPPPERSWWRRAHRNKMPVHAVLEGSALDAAMPRWDAIDLTWEELAVLPPSWRLKLSEWRGVYYILDASDGKGYVGSAYGKTNLLGRWQSYAAAGHGGNRLLRGRDPHHFRFTILERVSPDMDPDEVIRREGSWKQRLHTRDPHGPNDN
jgi:hypothetical protein